MEYFGAIGKACGHGTITYLVDNSRFDVVATIDQCCICSSHLQWRRSQSLTKSIVVKSYSRDNALISDESGILTSKFYVRECPKFEFFEIVIKERFGDILCDTDHSDIT